MYKMALPKLPTLESEKDSQTQKIPTCGPGTHLTWSAGRGYYCASDEAQELEIEALRPAATPKLLEPIPLPKLPTPKERDVEILAGLKEQKPELFPREDPSSLFKRVFPELISSEATEGLTSVEAITKRINENPQAFLTDLKQRVSPQDAELVLRQFGASEGDLDQIIGWQQRQVVAQQLVATIFPEQTLESLATLAETDWEQFVKELQAGGRSDEKVTLLQMMGGDKEFIDKLLPPEPWQQKWLRSYGVQEFLPGETKGPGKSPLAPPRPQRLGEIVKAREAGAQPFMPEPSSLLLAQYPPVGDQSIRAFIAGVGGLIGNAGSTARYLGFEKQGETLSSIGASLQNMAPPDTTGEFDLADLLNPDWYVQKVVPTIPFSLSIAPLALAGYIGGGALATAFGISKIGAMLIGSGLAGVLSRGAESAMEAGQAYDDAIARGKSESEAKKEADETFRNNMILGGADAWEIFIALAPTPKWVPAALVKSNLVKVARVGGKMVIVGLSEGGEEVVQSMITRHARGEEWKLDPMDKEVFAIGAVMGLGMGLGGDVVTGVIERAKSRMSTALKGQFDQAVGEGKTELQALDVGARTPEGEKLLVQIISEFKTGVTPTLEVQAGIEGLAALGKGEMPEAIGRQTVAYGPDPSKAYQMQYKLVELEDLIPSHTDAFAPNPAYPSELQPRMRERGPARADVNKIAAKLVPEVLIQDSNMIDRGPPIIGSDNVVESGNGRVMALRMARDSYPERWQAYQQTLKEALPQFGFEERRVSQMQNPVLVRERVTDVDRVTFTSEANQPAVAVFSPLENALQDSKRIRFENLVVPDITQSLDTTLRTASNRPFIASFLETLSSNERNSLVDAAGELNLLGMQRIKAAMFARTYPGEAGRRLTRIFFESREPLIRNIEEGMLASLPKMARAEELVSNGQRQSGLSLAEDLGKSLDMLAVLRQRKLTVPQYLAQRQLFEKELTPFQEQLLQHIEGIANSPRKVREFLGAFADAVTASPHPQQGAMLAGGKITKEALFNDTLRRQKEGPLFAAQTETPTVSPAPAGEPGLVAEAPGVPQTPEAPAVAKLPVEPAGKEVPVAAAKESLIAQELAKMTVETPAMKAARLERQLLREILPKLSKAQQQELILQPPEFRELFLNRIGTLTSRNTFKKDMVEARRLMEQRSELAPPGAPAVAKAPQIAKEPWMMTRKEVLTIAERDFPTQQAKQVGYFAKARVWHKTQVEKALSEGKPVPPEVLKDYPDLVAKPVEAVAPSAPEAAKEPFIYSTGGKTPRFWVKAGEPAMPLHPKSFTTRAEAEAFLAEQKALPKAPQPVVSPVPPVEPVEAVTPQAVEALVPVVTAQEIITPETGDILTPVQSEAILTLFKQFLTSPDLASRRAATLELRTVERAQRAASYKDRLQELIIEGKTFEEAQGIALKETMSGQLPRVTGDVLSNLDKTFQKVLFDQVHTKLGEDTFAEISTVDALRNAIETGEVPMERPTPPPEGFKSRIWPQGASAYDKLLYIFGDRQLVEALNQKKPLKDVIEGIFQETGREPIPLDQEALDYLRSLKDIPLISTRPQKVEKIVIEKLVGALQGQIALEAIGEKLPESVRLLVETRMETAPGIPDTRTPAQRALDLQELQAELAAPPQPVTPFEAPIEEAFKQLPMFKLAEKQMIVRVLKEAGMVVVDIGNFIRANKASLDNSFLRQSKVLASGHPAIAYQAHNVAWQAMFNQKAADAAYERIIRHPDYLIYDNIRRKTKADPLRVPASFHQKGTARYRRSEEFGFPTSERFIPRITAKIPWVKLSERGFTAGTNEIVWGTWLSKLAEARRYSEKIASGQIKLKEGEAFSIEKEMADFQKFEADAIQRASLGRAEKLAPEISALFFAARSKLGRFLLPRHLISANPRVRAEAWKDLTIMTSFLSGLMLLGDWLDLWDTEKDPRNAEFMSARIGNTRIDPWAGHRQFVVLYARLATGTGISSVTGAEYEVNKLAALQNFVRGSLASLPSILLEFWTGRNFLGAVVDIADKKAWLERLAPFSVVDVWQAFEENWKVGALSVIPAVYGEGVQTYTGDWKDNIPKLGLPKYSENLSYGLKEPIYDTEDLWADTASQFKGVDPATVTEKKGFPPIIRAIVEALGIRDKTEDMLNQKLSSINVDPAKGTTLTQYYQMWQERQKIVASGDEKKLKEFDTDERTKSAKLGNITQRQYALLLEYHSLPKTEQAKFLKEHPELDLNPYQDWLKAHPKENAQLALWGQAKIRTPEAYKEVQRLIKELDIPDAAVPKFTLPPEKSVESYFKYQDMQAEGKGNSWKAQLMLAKDDDLRKFLEREPIKTPVASLELRVKNQANYDKLASYSDRDSPDFISNEKSRAEAVKKLKSDNPGWVDDMRRIEAIEHKGEALAESWVERGKIADKAPGFNAEEKLWLAENPEVHKWALENKLLTASGETWNIPVLKIDVKYRKEDAEYDALPVTGTARADYLKANPEYRQDRRRREAYSLNPQKFPATEVENYVKYTELPVKGYRQERFLLENPEFLKAMVAGKGLNVLDASKIPPVEYDEILEKYAPEFEKLAQATTKAEQDALRFDAKGKPTDFRIAELHLEAYKKTPQMVNEYVTYYTLPKAGYRQERFLMQNPEFAKSVGLLIPEKVPSEQYDVLLEKENKTPQDKLAMEAYKLYVPDKSVNDYVGYYSILNAGKPPGQTLWYEDDWWMMEHQDFYRDVYLGILKKERKDYRTVPTREVFAKYQRYDKLTTTKEREAYRRGNRDLDSWLMLKFGLKPVGEEKPPAPPKPPKPPKAQKLTSSAQRLASLRERLAVLGVK